MSKSDKDRLRHVQNKCQEILNLLLKDDDNKYCVDCDAKGPRWASWNIGIFLCIRCAGIHRNLGVHISKVKSVNLDSWTPEQVAMLEQMGNSKARAVYEANLPDNFRRPQTDSSLESFIRAKYEMRRYIAKEWTPLPALKFPQMWDMEEDKKNDKKTTKLKAVELIDTSKSDKFPNSGNFKDSVSSPLKPSSSNSSNIPNLLELDLTPSPSDTFGQFESALPISTSAELMSCNLEAHNTVHQLESCPSALLTDSCPATIKSNSNSTTLEPSPNQAPLLTSKESSKDSKLTKDSILALYKQSNINLPMQRPQGVFPSSNNYQFGMPSMGQNPTYPPQPTYGLPPDPINNPFLTRGHNLPASNSYPFVTPGLTLPGTASPMNPNMSNLGNPMSIMLGAPQPVGPVQPDPFNQMHQRFSSLDLLSSNTPSNNFLGKALPNLPTNHPTQQQTPGSSSHSITTNLWQ